MLVRKIFTLVLLAAILYNCQPENRAGGIVDNFDHASQALRDRDSITKFLESYYYNDISERVEKFADTVNSPLLLNDARLRSLDVVEDEVDYTLYYLMLREGNPVPEKGNPTVVDSVLTVYSGFRIADNETLTEFETLISPAWLRLDLTIRGWTYAFPNFKGGENITTNGPVEYTGGGKGVVIIPSGLAYRNTGLQPTIPGNSNLLFYFDLYDIVEDTDTDNDLIPSILEDVDGDGDPRNDDSDGDILPDYLDPNDDNDSLLTRDELELKEYTTNTNNMPFTSETEAKAFFTENAAENEIFNKIVLLNGNYVLHTVILKNTSNADSPDVPDYRDPDTN